MTNEELELIRKRAEAATAGPWIADGDEITSATVLCHKYNEPVTIAETFHDYADDDFIAHAREDVPKLLAEIERLKELAHEILEDYDRAERRVIDEVSTNRHFAIKIQESVINLYKNEIDGVDDDGANI